jgi:Spy/CpxP family protein refolding chaperone
MKRINAAALGAALLVGFVGVAGAQATTTPQTQQGQKQGVSPRGERRGGGDFRRGGHRGRRGMRGMRGGFGGGFARDLNLTDAQKTQLRAIHDKYRPQFETIRTQMKSQADNVRALRQKGDTVAARAAAQKLRSDIDARVGTIRKQEIAEFRDVLTAEQRTKFDAAQAERQKRIDEWQKNGGKFNRRGHRGQRS